MADNCSYCSSSPPDFDEASYDLALRLLSGARATAGQLNDQLEGIKEDIRRSDRISESLAQDVAERETRIRELELGIVRLSIANKGRVTGDVMKILRNLMTCPECHGDGFIDTGACGDPECCGGNPSCEYCDGDGTLRGRFESL